MALSDREKQILAQMEAGLREEDPKLVSKINTALPSEPEADKESKLSPKRVAVGSIGTIFGLAVVVAGVSLGVDIWSVVLGVVGFVIMVSGVLWALKPVTTSRPSTKKADSDGEETSGFMDRQREQWERRRNQ